MRLIALLTLFVCSLSIQATATEARQPSLQLQDVFALEYASSPILSRDGKTAYFIRNFMDINSDQQYSNIWSVSLATRELRPITSGFYHDGGLQLSPDGSRLAFISDRNGSPQIHIVWLDDLRIAPISNLSKSPASLSWSPDGRLIAFSMFVPQSSRAEIKIPAKPEGAKWAEPPKLIQQVHYRHDGRGYADPGYRHLFVLSANGGVARQITQGDHDHGGRISWSADGKALFAAANRRENAEFTPLNSDIYRFELDTGSATQLTERDGPDYFPVVSPNGKQIAYLGHDDHKRLHETTHLHVMDVDGGNKRVISGKLDRDAQAPRWHPDGKSILFKYDDQGNTRIAKLTLDGKLTNLAANIGGTTLGRPYPSGQYTVSAAGQLVFTQTRPGHPAELAVTRVSEPGKTEKLTELNGSLLPFRNLSRVEEIRVPSSHDELPVHAWVAYPPGFDPDEKYPLLLEIHGGPVANYGPRFSAEVELFAAAGYIVVYANPRGSNSYGTEFVNHIHHNYPSQDYDDLISVVDAVIAKGHVDQDRLFVTGGSGGGVLTSWIIGHTDRFRAAVVAKPVINWYSFVLTADMYPYFYQYWFPALPWKDPEGYMKRSPISYVGNVKTPTMLLTGEADYRTPISETEQYYQALKLAGVDTAMVRIPDASHGITKRPSNLINKVAYILWWFEKYDQAGAAD